MSWLLVLPVALAAAAGGTLSDSTVVPISGVTVTGARVPESVLKTPAAISVVDRRTLQDTRGISLADGLQRVPGVFTQSRAGAQDVRITIRGYGARGNGERSNAGNMRGIRVLTDGIPLTEPDGRTSLEFVDIGGTDQVEVLRSNGSALYGNASGGVVNLRTSLDFARPYVEVGERAGSFGYHREQVLAGLAMGRGRATVSVLNSDFEGWRGHSGSSVTSVQTRFGTPLDEHTRFGVLADFASTLNFYPGALTQAQLDADPEQANPTYVTRNERRFNRVGRVGFTLDQDIEGRRGFALATWVEPKVLQRSERNRFRDFTRFHVGGSATYHVHTRLADGLEGVWMAGADEQFQDGAILFYSLLPGTGDRSTNVVANKREGANSAGAFLQGELRWADDWSLRLAARYDNLWYLSEDRIDPSLNATDHYERVTPKASLARYFARHTLYASVGGGVEAPAFNEIDPPPPYDTLTSLNPFLEPMISTSYELGAKGELAGADARFGRLGYDVALYWIDVKNEIVPFNGGAFFYTAGKTRRRGVELGADWAPLPRLTVNGAVTLSQNEYVVYANDAGDFGGRDVAGLPAVFANGEVAYRFPGGVTLAGNVQHVGSYYADDANAAAVDAHVLLGARLEYVAALPAATLRTFVAGDNLADERYVSSVFINGINGQYYEPGLPRNWSLGVSLSRR